jgi:hypothetical protein
MASLPIQMIKSLVDACLAARIDRESLLAGLPSRIVASMPTGNTPLKQLFYAWCHLNNTPWPADRQHPMNTALETCCLFAQTYGLADTFRIALDHFAEPATLDTSKDRAFYELFTRRMKETYLDFSCRVTPGIDDPPGPFMVEHPDKRTSIVGVFHDGGDKGTPLGVVIASVQQWLHLARCSGEDAEGYIVLAPSARRVDREQVLLAQLHPIDYGERRSVSFDAIKTMVRCLLGVDPPSEEAGFSIIQRGEAYPAEDALEAFLRDFRTRVWLLLRPREADTSTFQQELFHVAAKSFLRYGPPAPLPLGMDWRTRRVTECASDVFTRHGVPVSPIVLERVLREGVLCPILADDALGPPSSPRDSLPTPRLIEVMSEHSKLLVVFPPEDWAAARHVEDSLHRAGYEASVVRAFANVV